MKTYICFYIKGGRIGSIENTSENLAEAHRLMHLSLIQQDITGTLIFEVFGLKKAKRIREL